MVYSTIDFAESQRFLRRARSALTVYVVCCPPGARAEIFALAAYGLLGGNANSASGALGVLRRMSILT